MEAILGHGNVPFETIISDLFSNNEKRSEAESMYNMMKRKHADSLALKLAEFMSSNSYDVASRQNCCVLLEKLVTDDEGRIWDNLSEITQSSLKNTILNCIKFVESSYISKNLCCIVSKIYMHNSNWPQLLLFLNECVDSNTNNRLKECFFLIFAELNGNKWKILVPDIIITHSVFLNVLNDTVDPSVKTAVVDTAVKFITCLPRVMWFQNLLPAMMRTLTDTLSNDEDLAQQVLERFISLAMVEPRFFKLQLRDVTDTMFDIAGANNLEEKTRTLAVQFVLTLVEAREKAPGMMRKLPLFAHTCFAVLLNMLLNIRDEPSWHNAETGHENAGETTIYSFGTVCFERVSIALGAKTIAPVAVEQTSAFLVAPEWEKRHAALIALAHIADSHSKVMIKYLEQVVNMVLHSFLDPHPRVRWAAINAVKKLLIDFCPDLQGQYHDQVLPALATAMDDFENPQVQALAATALMVLSEYRMTETLVPYLDGILSKLVVLIQNDNQMVQGAALNALSVLSHLSKGQFENYYDIVMPCLRTILVNANEKSNNQIRDRALDLECISFVGAALGKEKFGDDLKQVMEVLKALQESQVKDFDNVVHIVHAYSGIGECMGKDFLPYMSTTMPFLFEIAQLEPDKNICSCELKDSIHKVKFGNEIVCIRGSILLLGKSQACSVICLQAHRMKEEFYPWISEAASTLVPLLKFYVHGQVRRYAIYAMQHLLHSAILAVCKWTPQGGNGSYFKHFEQLSAEIILAMGDALYSEPETNICALILSELNHCLMICGPLLNAEQVHSIIDVIKHVITESSRRKGELAERARSEDFDAEEAVLLGKEREQEDNLLVQLRQILHTFIKILEGAFFPFFDELLPYLIPMWGKDKTAEERHTPICISAIIVMECPEAATRYCNIFLRLFLDASKDEEPVVRQSSLYGLGLYAEYGGFAFNLSVREAISTVNEVIMHFRAREPENELAYDNAVSSLGKICRFHGKSVDLSQIIPIWLNCLPIKGDLHEAKDVHDQLCAMVGRLDKDLIGPNYQYIPNIISVFAEVLCSEKELATEETKNGMINVLRHLQQTLPAATMESACSYLLPLHEMALKSILSPEEDANF